MAKRGPKRKYSDAVMKKRRQKQAERYCDSEKGKATKKKFWTPGTEYYEQSRRSIRKYQLKKNFGLTLEDYDNMLEYQKGMCAICGGVNKNGMRLAVDHNHDTGEIRGLLCQRCNTHLGWYEVCKQGIEKYLK